MHSPGTGFPVSAGHPLSTYCVPAGLSEKLGYFRFPSSLGSASARDAAAPPPRTWGRCGRCLGSGTLQVLSCGKRAKRAKHRPLGPAVC